MTPRIEAIIKQIDGMEPRELIDLIMAMEKHFDVTGKDYLNDAFVAVPREPTDRMISAGIDAFYAEEDASMGNVFKAMCAAAEKGGRDET